MKRHLPVRLRRLLVLLLAALAAGIFSDWLREERVLFPRPLPVFERTVPPAR